MTRVARTVTTRKTYHQDPSFYHYLQAELDNGARPEEAVLSLAYEPPVYNPKTGFYEDFSHLRGASSANINQMIVEKRGFWNTEPLKLGQRSYRVSPPVPNVVHNYTPKLKNRKVEFHLQKQIEPSFDCGVKKDHSFQSQACPELTFTPKENKELVQITQINYSSAPQIEIVEQPSFIVEGPSFLNTEEGIIFSFLLFFCVWVTLLWGKTTNKRSFAIH